LFLWWLLRKLSNFFTETSCTGRPSRVIPLQSDDGSSIFRDADRETIQHLDPGERISPLLSSLISAAVWTQKICVGLGIVVSAADRAAYVYRNGNPIGRAAVEIDGRGSLGDHVYSLLESTTDRESSLAPGRAARRWMAVASRGPSVPAEKIAARLRINPELAQKVYDTIEPGTTVIITDQRVVRSRGNAAILEG
jgi:hypothetical protein